MSQKLVAKTCALCTHCEVDGGWLGTEATPGYLTSVRCRKNLFDEQPVDLVQLRKIGTACVAFDLMKES